MSCNKKYRVSLIIISTCCFSFLIIHYMEFQSYLEFPLPRKGLDLLALPLKQIMNVDVAVVVVAISLFWLMHMLRIRQKGRQKDQKSNLSDLDSFICKFSIN
jgi:hypothetical protein